MTSNICPSCQVRFDATRAGIARVRGARVVTFCSEACADVAPHAEVPPAALAGDEPPAPEITIIPAGASDPALSVSDAQDAVDSAPKVAADSEAASDEVASAPEATSLDEARPREVPRPVLAEQPGADVPTAGSDDYYDELSSSPVDPGDDLAAVSDDDLEDVELRPAKISDYQTRRSARRSKIIALSAAMLVGGMVITIISTVSPSSPSNVSAERAREAPPAPTSLATAAAGSALTADETPGSAAAPGSENEAGDPSSDPPVEVASPPELPSLPTMYAAATSVLQEYLASPSGRLQRIASGALARIHDQAAIGRLRELLAVERVELRKIEIAYALARTGDKEAKKLLRRRLGHKRRDVRLDAARSLIMLGDTAGAKVLERMLSVRSHRLGAAGLLARIGVPRGVKVLEKALAERKTSKENKMRATVALGFAGHESVRERLLEMLADRRYSVGAASALAALKNEGAVPILQQQLALPSLRVQAALSLRRLGADADLAVLEAALENGSDPARVSAAEAVLILGGPDTIVEFD